MFMRREPFEQDKQPNYKDGNVTVEMGDIDLDEQCITWNLAQ